MGGFVAKLDGDGTHVWSLSIPGGGYQAVASVAVDDQGYVALVGNALGDFDLGTQHFVTQGSDAYAALLDPAGSVVWSRKLGGPSGQWVESVAFTPERDMVIGGGYYKELQIDGQAWESMGGSDGFVARLDAEGNVLWVRSYGPTGDQSVVAVAVASDGIFVLGEFKSEIDMGVSSAAVDGMGSIFLTKLDDVGVPQWGFAYGDASLQIAGGLVATPLGNVLVAGDYGGTLDFGNASISTADATDAFVVKLGGDGIALWTQQLSGPGAQHVVALASDADGNVLLGGGYDDVTAIDEATLSPVDDSDGFVALLAR